MLLSLRDLPYQAWTQAAAAIAKEKGNELYKQHTKESYVSRVVGLYKAIRSSLKGYPRLTQAL